MFPALNRRDPGAYNKARVACAEYIRLEVEIWESKFRYVINCIKVTIHALDFVEVFEVNDQIILLCSVSYALVFIKEDNVFNQKISKEINDQTAAENRARASMFQAIAQAAHLELAESAIPAIVLHYPAKRSVFNQNVATFLNEANETLKQIMHEIEVCKKKHSHDDFPLPLFDLRPAHAEKINLTKRSKKFGHVARKDS